MIKYDISELVMNTYVFQMSHTAIRVNINENTFLSKNKWKHISVLKFI